MSRVAPAPGDGDSKEELAAGLAFPMWLVSVPTMLELAQSKEVLPKHEELMAQGRLVQWKPGMRTIFFSHTWLGYSHPDPRRDKSKLISALLEGIRAGRTGVTGYWMATIIFQEFGIKPRKLQRDFSDGYVWMDYLSIPQVDRANQGLAISSITSYVALTDLFMVLAGPWEHVDDGSVRDVRAWGERGWCRLENLANALSPVKKTFIVAQSPTNIYAYGPAGIVGRYWFQETVGRGNFTVDDDKLSLGPAILKMIELRTKQAEREGDLTMFRFLQAIANTLLHGTGVSLPEEPLDAWLSKLRFDSATDGAKSGLTPLRFAVIADRADLVRELLDRGADVESPLAGHWSKGSDSAFISIMPGDTILHSASIFSGSKNGDAECVKLLLAANADTRALQKNPPFGNVLLQACTMSKVEMVNVLHAADPTLWQTPHFMGILPFEECLMVGKPEACALALDQYAEQLAGLPEGAPRFLNYQGRKGLRSAYTRAEHSRMNGAGLVFYAVMHIGDVRVLKQVLDKGHDPNGDFSCRWGAGQKKLPMRVLGRVFQFISDRQRHPLGLMEKFANMDCAPLHMAALTGNLGAVNMLLEYGAKQTQMHSRKMTPLHLAAMGGHESCVDALLRNAEDGVNLAAIKDGTGRTPRSWAAKRGHAELATRLAQLAAGGAGETAPRAAPDKYRVAAGASDKE